MRIRKGVLALALAAGSLWPGAAPAQTLVVETNLLLDPRPGWSPGPATIVIRDGVIDAVIQGRPGGAAPGVPHGAPRLSAPVVLPGLVDARSTVGLAGLHPDDDDEDEVDGPVRPELRAGDGFDLREPLLVHALRSGVTVVHSGPGPSNSIGGRTGVFRTHARTGTEAVIREPAALVVSLSEEVKNAYLPRGRLPTTRMANVSLIRQAFLDAEHRAGAPEPPRTPREAAMEEARSGRVPVFIHADRGDEIEAAVRLAREFGLDAVIVGGREAALVADLLERARIPLILTPPGEALALAPEPGRVLGAGGILAERGLPLALGTGARGSGRTLLEWAVEVSRHGLSSREALRAVTLGAAELLGIDDRWGSVEEGKQGDLLLLDGDPFREPWRVEAVVVGGKVAHRRQE